MARTTSRCSLWRRRSSTVAHCKHVLVLDMLQSVFVNGDVVRAVDERRVPQDRWR